MDSWTLQAEQSRAEQSKRCPDPEGKEDEMR